MNVARMAFVSMAVTAVALLVSIYVVTDDKSGLVGAVVFGTFLCAVVMAAATWARSKAGRNE